MSLLSSLIKRYKSTNLMLQIFVGIILGILVGIFLKDLVNYTSLLGVIFVGALKAVAPILVFVLVLCAISTRVYGDGSKRIKNVIILYLIGTFLASVSAVVASFLFPTTLSGINAQDSVSLAAPSSIAAVFSDLLFKMIDNPINALATGNYIGILTWSIALGLALKNSSNSIKEVISEINDGTIQIVRFIVKLAPFGIFGLVSQSVKEAGINAMQSYLHLLAVLVFTMLFVAFVLNALIVFLLTKKNPYPLIFICIRHSALYAFFTRSSAANIPVNMALCAKLNVNKDLFSIAIPLGANINMAGAAVTIAILALSTAHTLGINISFTQALILSFIAALGACGASGVAGGSLLLVPLACSLFGISDAISLKVVAIGFIIGVIQDSIETALNSSTDVLFTAICSDTKLNLDFKKD